MTNEPTSHSTRIIVFQLKSNSNLACGCCVAVVPLLCSLHPTLINASKNVFDIDYAEEDRLGTLFPALSTSSARKIPNHALGKYTLRRCRRRKKRTFSENLNNILLYFRPRARCTSEEGHRGSYVCAYVGRHKSSRALRERENLQF